jgi:hypothetical protein
MLPNTSFQTPPKSGDDVSQVHISIADQLSNMLQEAFSLPEKPEIYGNAEYVYDSVVVAQDYHIEINQEDLLVGSIPLDSASIQKYIPAEEARTNAKKTASSILGIKQKLVDKVLDGFPEALNRLKQSDIRFEHKDIFEGARLCGSCTGSGEIDCPTCQAQGTEPCPAGCFKGIVKCRTCGGTGKDDHGKRCNECMGQKNVKCYTCSGLKHITCRECDGNKQVPCPDCEGKGGFLDTYQAIFTLPIHPQSKVFENGSEAARSHIEFLMNDDPGGLYEQTAPEKWGLSLEEQGNHVKAQVRYRGVEIIVKIKGHNIRLFVQVGPDKKYYSITILDFDHVGDTLLKDYFGDISNFNISTIADMPYVIGQPGVWKTAVSTDVMRVLEGKIAEFIESEKTPTPRLRQITFGLSTFFTLSLFLFLSSWFVASIPGLSWEAGFELRAIVQRGIELFTTPPYGWYMYFLLIPGYGLGRWFSKTVHGRQPPFSPFVLFYTALFLTILLLIALGFYNSIDYALTIFSNYMEIVSPTYDLNSIWVGLGRTNPTLFFVLFSFSALLGFAASMRLSQKLQVLINQYRYPANFLKKYLK